jgi:hypothetical protein
MGKLRWHKHTGILKKKEATRTSPFSNIAFSPSYLLKAKKNRTHSRGLVVLRKVWVGFDRSFRCHLAFTPLFDCRSGM